MDGIFIRDIMASTMKIHLQGTAEFDPFGIPMLKHNSHVDQVIELGSNDTRRIALPIGPLTLGAAVDVEGEDIILDLKISLLNFPLYDEKLPLAHHVANGKVNIGSTQLGFVGTIEITE